MKADGLGALKKRILLVAVDLNLSARLGGF